MNAIMPPGLSISQARMMKIASGRSFATVWETAADLFICPIVQVRPHGGIADYDIVIEPVRGARGIRGADNGVENSSLSPSLRS